MNQNVTALFVIVLSKVLINKENEEEYKNYFKVSIKLWLRDEGNKLK